MSDAYIGEIRLFAGSYAPKDWAFCEGQLLAISQHTALFSILGTQFGGDGKTIFALPNLQGAAPMGQGQGPGLSMRYVGESAGEAAVALQASQIPPHTHTAQAVAVEGDSVDPEGRYWAESKGEGRPRPIQKPYYTEAPDVKMNPAALGLSGSNMPHNNMQPYVAVNYIICLNGVFPPRQE